MDKKVKVALILCPCWTNFTPPLGIAYLSSVAKNKGFEARCFDINIELSALLREEKIDYWGFQEHYRWGEPNFSKQILPLISRHLDSKAEEILAYNPDIVGFSIFYTNTAASLYLAEQLKKRNPGKKIIFGGQACFNENRDHRFLNTGFIDMVVIGEGEQALEEIIETYSEASDFRDIKGTIIKENSHFSVYERREEINNLDLMPLPDFIDFNLTKYLKPALPIMTSRGCVGKCAFCGEIAYWKSFRFRSAENIFKEIKRDVECFGIKNLFFNDSLINGNLKELSKLLDLIISNKLRISWGGYVRVNKAMTPELFKKLKKAGCDYLSYGIESGSQKVLKDMNKQIILTDAEINLAHTVKAQIQAHVNWIAGFPTESWIDFLKSLIFIYKNRKHITHFNPGQRPCGIPPDSDLANNPDKFKITSRLFLNSWRTRYFKNTIIHRQIRLKVLRMWISLLRMKHS
jgi:anaerobic magnesium-protoporphyrin IX monomethyl ester cyclase